MSKWGSAIHANLVADGTLTALVTTYASAPAIFYTPTAPEDAVLPYIIIGPTVSVTMQNSGKTENLKDVTMDIRIFTETEFTFSVLSEITDRVRTVLHRATLSVADHSFMGCHIQNEIDVPIDRDVIGKALTFRIQLQEN